MKDKNLLPHIEGVWESVNLNPAVVIYRDYNGPYYILILHVNISTLQASPAMHRLMKDGQGYFFGVASSLQRLAFDPISDTLTLSQFGDYLRNS